MSDDKPSDSDYELNAEFHNAVRELAEEYNERGVAPEDAVMLLGFVQDNQRGKAESDEYVGPRYSLSRDVFERCREAEDELPAHMIARVLCELEDMYRMKARRQSADNN